MKLCCLVLGAKPPKILENIDEFVLKNESGTKESVKLGYFGLGRSPNFFTFSVNLSSGICHAIFIKSKFIVLILFGGVAPENFRNS